MFGALCLLGALYLLSVLCLPANGDVNSKETSFGTMGKVFGELRILPGIGRIDKFIGKLKKIERQHKKIARNSTQLGCLSSPGLKIHK